jgi:serine/threonine protein kinase/tetratricopeptide (TPR) repeat protein
MEGFTGQERFEVRERLGEGGFGTVYAAFDRELGIPVALKQLRQRSPEAIYRFKKEFRLLAEMAHPNLVSLYELFQSADAWYFTMELVPGRHMLEHLRPELVPVEQAVTVEAMPTHGQPRRERVPVPSLDLDHVRIVFGQLAEALCALHEAGLLHRDVKPSNILVTPDRRVVVLDFGLATETRPLAANVEGEVVGTPLYMSPEQWTAGPVTEASDWYSFGVVLYEALTGVPPFDGSPSQIGTALFTRRPIRPQLVDPAIPEHLSQLCQDLLQVTASERPTGPEVLRRLQGRDVTELHTDRPRHVFISRKPELAQLHAAFAAVAPGRPVVVELSGESGLGKTALCEHFLSTLVDSPEALVLVGRSYEQETLPYRAFDGVIDELSRVLLRRWQTTAHAWPRAVADLTRLFPVLGRVPGFVMPASKMGPAGEPLDDGRSALEVRRSAVEALRELLRELGREQHVVMLLDDVHWGDVDSAVLLHQLLESPDAPPLLLLLTYRNEDGESSPFLRELRALAAASADTTERRRMVLERIPAVDCEALATALLQRRRTRPGVVAELAREAAGNPLLLEELVRFTHSDTRASQPHTPDLEQRQALLEHMVVQRIDELPEPWQRFLSVVGLAGRPVDVEIARHAAGLDSIDRTLLNRLRAGHLLRTRHTDGREQVAPYHDRIREIVARALEPEERRGLHLALASAYAASRTVLPGLVAKHLYEAGELDRAADYALRAAAEAEAALAFDEAAELYGKALDWRPADRKPLAKHAEALANAGRCAEAAPRYLEAARLASGMEALLLRRAACEQYLLGGHSDEGLALLDDLCAQTGLSRPKTPARAMLGVGADLLRLRWRGLDFVERAEKDLDALVRFRIDLCYSASRSLAMRDPIASTRFSARALLLALAAGEPSRVVEGMSAVGTGLAVVGSPMGVKLLDRAQTIADRLGTPYVLGLHRFWSAFVAQTRGRWTEALAAFDEAQTLLRQCRGVQSEIQKAELSTILDLQLLGRFDELARRTERAAADARASGNRYSEVCARLYSAIPPLAADQPAVARERIDEALARAPVGDHYIKTTALKFECFSDLYAGRPDDGLRRVEAAWPMLKATGLMRSANFRLVFHGLRAGLLLAARGDDPAALSAAEADVNVCADSGYPYASGQTAMWRAAIAARRGKREVALAAVDAALAAFAEADLPLESAYARRRRGQLLSGSDGRALVVEAEAALRARGIVNPLRWVRSQAPGFPEPQSEPEPEPKIDLEIEETSHAAG